MLATLVDGRVLDAADDVVPLLRECVVFGVLRGIADVDVVMIDVGVIGVDDNETEVLLVGVVNVVVCLLRLRF